MNPLPSYRELIVWQRSMELAVSVYEVTRNFPKEELFGITSQMRRAAISIPSNIAEGKYRSTRKDFLKFLYISYASGAELETQVTIAKQLETMLHFDYSDVDAKLSEVMKMLNKMIQSLKKPISHKLSANL